MDLYNDVNKQMLKGWNTVFKGMLKDFTYRREAQSYVDPITELPITPEDNINFTLKAIKRTAKKESWKDPDLSYEDIKLSVRVDQFTTYLDKPAVNDKVDLLGSTYRVAKWEPDSVDCFYHLD